MATLYCGPSNSGNGSGSNFSNLLALPNTTGFTRGNTYVIVDGSYGSKTLSTAASGSTTITIKKASAADSGVTGYSAALQDGQAVFGTITVHSQYWIVNGMTRTESTTWTAPTGYGFKATQIYANSNNGDDAAYSQFWYIDLGTDYSLTYSGSDEAVYIVYNQHDLTFHRCAMHMSIHAIMQAVGADNITVEYCHIGPGWGKKAIRAGNSAGESGWVIRYNRFWESTQIDPEDGTSGITAEIAWFGDGGSSFSNNAVYGNWFYNTKYGNRNACIQIGGGGFPDTAVNCVVYNNTFAGISDAAVFGMIYLVGSGNIARNNLFYNSASTSVTANTASNNVVATVNPFVDYTNRDYRITYGSQAHNVGYAIGSPYNVDPLGVTRGADGTWDVGAYEYDSGATPPSGTITLSVR